MSIWYYYDEGKKKQGPINSNQLVALASRGIILPETVVETETGQQGPASQVSGLHFPPGVSGFPNPPGPPIPPKPWPTGDGFGGNSQTVNVPKSQSVPSNKPVSAANRLERYCNIYIYGIIAEIVLVLLVLFGTIFWAMINSSGTISKYVENPLDVVYMIIISIVSFLLVAMEIAIICYWYKFLYLAWSIIPKENAKTTPNKAVGYCFIPFFSFYWIFVMYQGLPEGINKSLEDRGIGIRASEGLGTTIAVLWCWTVIPYFFIIPIILLLIFSIRYIKSIKNAAVALVNASSTPGPR